VEAGAEELEVVLLLLEDVDRRYREYRHLPCPTHWSRPGDTPVEVTDTYEYCMSSHSQPRVGRGGMGAVTWQVTWQVTREVTRKVTRYVITGGTWLDEKKTARFSSPGESESELISPSESDALKVLKWWYSSLLWVSGL